MTALKITDRFLKTAKQSRHLALIGLVAVSTSASGNETVFGSDNAGYGGFTADTQTGTGTPAPVWELTSTAARFSNAPTNDSGQVNASLLKDYTLSRADGSSATITGVLHIESTYPADNNRFAIALFADTSDVAGVGTGLSLQHNLGNGAFRILSGGVNGTVLITATYGGLNGASAIGTTFTYRADLTFVGTDIEIDFTLTDQNNLSEVLEATVAAASFTGTHYGFGTRGRVRNNSVGINDIPFIYQAKSFSVVDVPPPSSGPFTVSILPNATTPGNYDFTWTSQAGKEYDLVSNTELSTPINTWLVWEGHAGLPATPPNNVLADVPGGGDTRRFFAVVERDAPPLFAENFDAAAELPAGWARDGIVNGTDWDVGVPSGVLSGPAAAFTEPNCAGTNIGGYYTENVDVSLITPVIAIPAASGATLVFRQLIDTDGVGDLGAVRVLDADNADAPIVGLALTGIGGLGITWTENTLVLPALDVGGKNIKIEFNFVSDTGTIQDINVFGGFYVDDVSVSLN
jgi:hypothetical protein